MCWDLELSVDLSCNIGKIGESPFQIIRPFTNDLAFMSADIANNKVFLNMIKDGKSDVESIPITATNDLQTWNFKDY